MVTKKFFRGTFESGIVVSSSSRSSKRPQQQQQSYITPWWLRRATADFVWQTTVWFGNLLKKINPS